MIEVRVAREDELGMCLAVRREVFIDGQNVPEDEEVDGQDPICTHFLVFEDDTPVGAARLRVADGVAKAERVAIRERWRRRGLGDVLMDAVEAEAHRLGHATIVLGAQSYIVPFYEARGYEAYGDEFMDAGIPHRMMRRALP